MSLLRGAPLARQSTRARARAGQLAKTKRALLARAGYQSECCQRRDVRLDHHHVFGHHGLGAWNDSPECGAVVCREHHRRLTDEQEPTLKARLEWAAVRRLADRLSRETGERLEGIADRPPAAVARELVARLDAAGATP